MNAGADPARSNYDLMLRPQFIGCRSSICSTVYTGGPTSPLSRGALFTTISLQGPETASRALVGAQGRINRERNALAPPALHARCAISRRWRDRAADRRTGCRLDDLPGTQGRAPPR